MCGRYGLSLPEEEISALFDDATVPEPYVPRYNIAPGQDALVATAGSGGIELGMARWGYQVPSVAGSTVAPRPINARSESVATRALFRESFRSQRCLVPASGFFEWRRGAGGRVPYWVSADGPLAFAGVWTSDDLGRPTFAVLTRAAPDLLSHIHDRCPVLVAAPLFRPWLDRNADRRQLEELMRASLPSLRAHPVSTRVNHVDQDDPDLLRVVAEALELPLG